MSTPYNPVDVAYIDFSTVFVVMPFFKNGLASDVNNYRQISLTSTCCKTINSSSGDEIAIVNFFYEDIVHIEALSLIHI